MSHKALFNGAIGDELSRLSYPSLSRTTSYSEAGAGVGSAEVIGGGD